MKKQPVAPTYGCLPPGKWEEAYICAFEAMRQRALKAEARARVLEELLAWERLHRIEATDTPF